MYYVYIIKSVLCPERMYVGYTCNLKQRFSDHNSGKSPHTDKYKPWTLEVYFGFKDKAKAISFENYLKSSSGRAFSKKRF